MSYPSASVTIDSDLGEWKKSVSVSCAAGEVVLGGGFLLNDVGDVWVSAPTFGPTSGWTITVTRGFFTSNVTATVYAICVNWTS